MASRQALGVRISAGGEILDSPPIEIRSFTYSGEKIFGVASDGNGWGVFTTQTYVQGYGTNTRLVAQYVSGGGTLVGGLNYIFNEVRPTHPDPGAVTSWLAKRGFGGTEDGQLRRRVKP